MINDLASENQKQKSKIKFLEQVNEEMEQLKFIGLKDE